MCDREDTADGEELGSGKGEVGKDDGEQNSVLVPGPPRGPWARKTA